jgi:hypothetical protein
MCFGFLLFSFVSAETAPNSLPDPVRDVFEKAAKSDNGEASLYNPKSFGLAFGFGDKTTLKDNIRDMFYPSAI